MRYFKDEQKYVVVLEKGEDLFAALSQFAKEAGVDTAWLQGIGAALEVELGYYQLDKQEYHWKSFEGPLEIASLQGNIAQKDGQPVFHVHGTFATDDYGAIAGHVKKLVVAATCEIFIHKLEHKLTRAHDAGVGLELLQSSD